MVSVDTFKIHNITKQTYFHYLMQKMRKIFLYAMQKNRLNSLPLKRFHSVIISMTITWKSNSV